MFQQIILVIAGILLVLSLVVIGVLLWNAKATDLYPPEISSCPDYYLLSAKDQKCHNVKGLGNGGGDCNTIGFPPLRGKQDKQGREERCNWAKSCGVTWDGITNQNVC